MEGLVLRGFETGGMAVRGKKLLLGKGKVRGVCRG